MIVFGKNVAKEVIDSKKEIKKVYLSKQFDDEKLIKYFEDNNIKINRMDKRILDQKFKGNNQGIALEIEDYKYISIDEVLNTNFLVMLDHLEDPHNFGAIIRTCEAAGVDAIIIPKKRSVEITSTVMKVSAGALNNIKIVEVSSLPQTIEKLKKHGFWFYGTDMDGSNYTDVVYDSKTCLVIGAEGNGISKLVSEKCDYIISIPMTGKINSLNASVAAGITIYEVVRQKNEKL
jgi:23S rRNA (guanosine2251-2'-O)-methyltransferase